ncbi:MAG TPA: response regulator transcription factor [Abditibacteriaceae bacterium]|jgi:DNA-binding response OmpR family regulator
MATNISQQTPDDAGNMQPHSSQNRQPGSGHVKKASTNPRQQFRVLLVEGDYDIAQPILIGLEHTGFEVHYSPDMAGALHTLQEQDLHLIIIDLGLPNSQAPSLCRAVRQLSNMPIILTGNDNNLTTQVHAFHLGADDYVAHPCDPRLLVGRTAAVLRRSYHYSQARLLTAQNGAAHTRSQHAGALHNMPAGTQHSNQHPGQDAAHSNQSVTQHEDATLHPQGHLPKGWATCDTCGYIGPLEKFANPNSKAGFSDFHAVLCCPNCQHEDVARFSVG